MVVVGLSEFPYNIELKTGAKKNFGEFDEDVKEALLALKKLGCEDTKWFEETLAKGIEVVLTCCVYQDLEYFADHYDPDQEYNSKVSMTQLFAKRVLEVCRLELKNEIEPIPLGYPENVVKECKKATKDFVTLLNYFSVNVDAASLRRLLKAGITQQLQVLTSKEKTIYRDLIAQWKSQVIRNSGEVEELSATHLKKYVKDGINRFFKLFKQDVFTYRNLPSAEKGDLVFADLPYFLYEDRDFDKLEWCAGPGVTKDQFVAKASFLVKKVIFYFEGFWSF